MAAAPDATRHTARHGSSIRNGITMRAPMHPVSPRRRSRRTLSRVMFRLRSSVVLARASGRRRRTADLCPGNHTAPAAPPRHDPPDPPIGAVSALARSFAVAYPSWAFCALKGINRIVAGCPPGVDRRDCDDECGHGVAGSRAALLLRNVLRSQSRAVVTVPGSWDKRVAAGTW